jgi:Family of unknown function (DUF6885)
MPSSSEASVWEKNLVMRGNSPPQPQQRDNLCGPFHAARLLREAGVDEWNGEPLDQDVVALAAGSALPEVEIGPQVPPGADNLRDYRFELPRVDHAHAGTRVEGLVGAIEELSGGRLACVPLSGEWTGDVVADLVPVARDAGGRLIANLRTGHFWASRPPLEALVAVLDGTEVAEPPPADWDAGHFVELAELIRGRRGALVLVRDSYPTLGWGGVHLQPPRAVAAALNRGDGRSGGVLVVGPAKAAAEIERLAGRLGLHLRMWDNSR